MNTRTLKMNTRTLDDGASNWDRFIFITRLYTADAVWYRQPSGQPTNTVMLNLNQQWNP